MKRPNHRKRPRVRRQQCSDPSHQWLRSVPAPQPRLVRREVLIEERRVVPIKTKKQPWYKRLFNWCKRIVYQVITVIKRVVTWVWTNGGEDIARKAVQVQGARLLAA